MKEKNVLKEEDLKLLASRMENSDVLEKESAISWYGKNFMIRLPIDIVNSLKINKDNCFKKNIRFRIENKGNKESKTFEIVERIKPPRRIKNEKRGNKKNSIHNNLQ